MYQVHYLNSISPKGTALWTEDYQKTDDMNNADAVLVRSAAMHDLVLPENLLAIARAGAGVNNIPLDKCTEEGIVVFNHTAQTQRLQLNHFKRIHRKETQRISVRYRVLTKQVVI